MQMPVATHRRGIRFGLLLALLALAAAAAVALAATWILHLIPSRVLLAWLAVVVFTTHTGIMGSLGATYWLARQGFPPQP